MSEDRNRVARATPKTERWVIVLACAFIPAIAALTVPEAARIPLLAVSALVFVAGFALMLRESRRSRGNESLRRLVHAEHE